MEAKGISEGQLHEAAQRAHVCLDVRPVGGNGRLRVKVNPLDEKDADGNRWHQRVGFQGRRRIAAVCWHGFRDFFRACYELAPEAMFRTGVATYRGKGDFEEKCLGTGRLNVGSQMRPLRAADACVCPESGEVQ